MKFDKRFIKYGITVWVKNLFHSLMIDEMQMFTKKNLLSAY